MRGVRERTAEVNDFIIEPRLCSRDKKGVGKMEGRVVWYRLYSVLFEKELSGVVEIRVDGIEFRCHDSRCLPLLHRFFTYGLKLVMLALVFYAFIFGLLLPFPAGLIFSLVVIALFYVLYYPNLMLFNVIWHHPLSDPGNGRLFFPYGVIGGVEKGEGDSTVALLVPRRIKSPLSIFSPTWKWPRLLFEIIMPKDGVPYDRIKGGKTEEVV